MYKHQRKSILVGRSYRKFRDDFGRKWKQC